MSRPVYPGLVVFMAAATLGHFPASAQSAQPALLGGAVPLYSVVAPGLPGGPGSVQAPPQQIAPDRTRGALWGGGIGLVAGGLLGGLTVSSDNEDDFGGSITESSAVGEAVVLGAVVGAAIGALLGATVFAPSRQSASSDAGMLGLSLHPSGSAIAVTGRIRVGR